MTPLPPTEMVMPQTAQWLFTVIAGVLVLVELVIGILHVARGQGPLLLLCMLGGALASLFEPVVDALGMMFIPMTGAFGVFTFFGRGMPMFVPIAYSGYIGGLTYLAYRQLNRDSRGWAMQRLWAIFVVLNVAFETPAVLLHVYVYYGRQPLNFWGFPIWWSFVNSVSCILAGAVLTRLWPRLSGPRRLLALLVVPVSVGMANGGTAAPVWVALHQPDLAIAWTWIAALVTMALALLVIWTIASLIQPVPVDATEPRPARV